MLRVQSFSTLYEGGPPVARLRDVAKEAGVAISTASKVLSNSPAAAELSSKTKAAVRRAAKALRYRPHPIAHSLRTKKTRTVGFVAPHVPREHLGPIANGVEQVLGERDYRMLFSSADESLKKETYWLEYFSHCVDGLVVAVEGEPAEMDVIRRYVSGHNLPVVVVGWHPDIPGVASVALDGFSGARQAVRHLLELGHRRIAYLGGRRNAKANMLRHGGYKAAIVEAGLAYEPALVREGVSAGGCEALMEIGRQRAKEILSGDRDITALFAFNDVMAAGALRGVRESGSNVPGDVSVVGFDDLYWAICLEPPLTTVRQPRHEMGRAAAELLLERLSKSGEETAASSEQRVTIEPELVVRASTAPPG